MYSEKIESLIKAALADGVLTEKEKQILFKKAQSEGIDLDEFEMVLDARLVEIEKEANAKAASAAPKSNKYGDVRKCPSCGAMVPALAGVCPECGYEFSGIEANLSSQKLSELLQKAKGESERASIISSFPIPTTKADLFEFVTTMKTQADSTEIECPIFKGEKKGVELKNAYLSKYEESILKIRSLFPQDPIFLSVLSDHDAFSKKIRKGITIQTHKKTILAALVVLLIGMIFFFHKSDETIINDQAAKVTELVNAGELTEADKFLCDLTIMGSVKKHGTGRVVDTYDSMFFVLINAYVQKGDLDSAEKLALVWRGKIGNDLSWVDSSCYKLLKSKFKSEGRDFSSLKSHYDYLRD